jgi:hypothetical protein
MFNSIKAMILFVILLCSILQVTAQKANTDPLDGKIVFAPLAFKTTYMIDEGGAVVKTWNSSYFPGLSVYWMADNSICRMLAGGGGGEDGGVQIISSDDTILWEFLYKNDTHAAHHDGIVLPNGHILMLAYEAIITAKAIEWGRDPQYITNNVLTEHIIEVEPTSPTEGDIVWEWKTEDHLIQEYDDSKENYGIVFDHPELIDFNYGSENDYDWLHGNSLDYNEKLNQIIINIRNFNEFWIIDHSTTTAEAANHSGGRYGRGGDLLYRWGNPEAYDRGDSSDRKFFWQHDANWVKDGYPGGGNILVFNNGVGRYYSSVDEVVPPIDPAGNYSLVQNQPYAPESCVWSYTQDNFFAWHLSGAERLPNGNTLICQGEKGEFFVVTPNKEVVWAYDFWIPPPVGVIFKPFFIPNIPPPTQPDLDVAGSLEWNRIKPGNTVMGQFQVKNIGTGRVNWTIDTSLITWGNWSFSQSSGSTYANYPTTVHVTLVVPNASNSEFEGYLKVINTDDTEDYALVPVMLKTSLDDVSLKTSLELNLKKAVLSGGRILNPSTLLFFTDN